MGEYNIWVRGTKVICTVRSAKIPKDSTPWSKISHDDAQTLVHNPPLEKMPPDWLCTIVDRLLNFMTNLE
jgi:hypothetical protein